MTEQHFNFDVGKWADPAKLLIEKISNAVEGTFKPFQTVRVAKADAEAALINAQSQVKITELQQRAMHRFINEEAKKQENIEAITEKAIPLLEANANPGKMDDDWVSNFFDKCRIVSDGEMQKLWGKVLAGEANAPGSFSKRTVNFIGSLDARDAIAFTKLCGFGWFISGVRPLIYNCQDPVYTDFGVTFDSLTHLDSIGLIAFNGVTSYTLLHLPKSGIIHFYGQGYLLEFPSDDYSFQTGAVMLTQAGQQLAPICGASPAPGCADYVVKKWHDMNISVSCWLPRAEVLR